MKIGGYPAPGAPDRCVSHEGCGTVSHTDSCGPRSYVFMYVTRGVLSPHSVRLAPRPLPNPYVLSTSMIQCMAYMTRLPYVDCSSPASGSAPAMTDVDSGDGYWLGWLNSGA